jgi:DNA-binding CsgD family transcriptional regulator
VADLGVGIPVGLFREPVRQDVLETASVLQLQRGEVAHGLTDRDARGGPALDGAEVMARGNEQINVWMMRAAHEWRELLSVRPTASAAQLRMSMPNNDELLRGGIRMVSVFDHYGLEREGRAVLAAAGAPDVYRVGLAPVQMKIVDRGTVLLQGPFLGRQPSVMAVRRRGVVAAAWRYWHAVLASCDDVGPVEPAVVLTARQRRIMALLATDLGDEAIAAALGVSVRTVRADIAEVQRALGVRSRFAAGARLQELRLLGDD